MKKTFAARIDFHNLSKEKASGKSSYADRIIKVNRLHRLEHARHGFDNWRFQCGRQKCEYEELHALVDDDPTQTTLSSTMINLNFALIEK